MGVDEFWMSAALEQAEQAARSLIELARFGVLRLDGPSLQECVLIDRIPQPHRNRRFERLRAFAPALAGDGPGRSNHGRSLLSDRSLGSGYQRNRDSPLSQLDCFRCIQW